jgi:hypothetical protein
MGNRIFSNHIKQYNKYKMKNDYISLHRSRFHCHIAIKYSEFYIYDNSGTDPDTTDDGPLIVAEDMLREAGGIKIIPGGEFGPTSIIPVRHPGGFEAYSSNIDLEGAIKLARKIGLKVDMVTNIYDPKPKEEKFV